MTLFWISFVCIYRWPPFGPDIIISLDMLISLGLISFGMVFSCMLVGMGSCLGCVPGSTSRIRAVHFQRVLVRFSSLLWLRMFLLKLFIPISSVKDILRYKPIRTPVRVRDRRG